MTTTKSPAEAYSQQAEAISREGRPMRWMDTAARLAPLVGLGVLGYAERRRQARADARDAQEFYDRLDPNYARIDVLEAARAAAQARRDSLVHRGRSTVRAVQAAGPAANHDWRVGMVAGAASVQSRNRPPLTRYERGEDQDWLT